MQRVIIAIALMIIASACNVLDVQNAYVNAAVETRVAATVDAILPAPAPTSTLPAGTSCTIRTDWLAYTVTTGDTLANIAQRSGSTVTELVTANCLTNPNIIEVGQVLRIPRLPAPQPPPASPAGAIRLTPFSMADASNYTVPVGTVVTLTWDNVPASVTHVEYYYTRDGSSTSERIATGAPNASVTWQIGPNVGGSVIAHGRVGEQNNAVRSNPIYVYVADTSASEIFIMPHASHSGSTFTVVEQQHANIIWLNAPLNGASHVEFYYERTTSSGTTETINIGADATLANGASASWLVPVMASGRIYAVAHFPNGSTHTSQSATFRTIPQPESGGFGRPVIAPSTLDGQVAIVRVDATVTITWPEVRLFDGPIQVEYLLYVDGSDQPESLGTSTEIADAAPVQWTVPQILDGRIEAHAQRVGQPDAERKAQPMRVRAVILGAEHPVISVGGAFQDFENGFMIWRADTGAIWVLEFGGRAIYFSLAAYADMPDNPVPENAPPGFIKPASGFGKVWGNYNVVRDALGWAVTQEQGYTINITGIAGETHTESLYSLPDGRRVLMRPNGTWRFYP